MAAAESLPIPKLVDLLLEEQQSLTAVERFSEQHDADTIPLQRRYYEDLIPASAPGPGQQYAFRVDLDACTGCKACVTACHNLNGLGSEETWRDVGLLLGGTEVRPQLQTVTAACHHCEDPACLHGCPVNAYEKDATTGIVRHLDDQCIGCQYCTLQCPYDVPKYDATMGIVRKCDMCSDRLSVGEAPACVQGCPNEAISIDVVTVGDGPEALLPATPGAVPDSHWTRPTTRYITERDLGGLRPSDGHRDEPADPHHPLSVMLVLTQLAVGVTVIEALLGFFGSAPSLARLAIAGVATLAGLGVANLHLGRPQYAYRVILGVFRSWMSREILVLGGFAGIVAAYVASAVLPGLWPELQAWVPEALVSGLGLAAALTGLAAVFCSAMIYADTPRRIWRWSRTGPLFFATTALLGVAGLCVGSLFDAAVAPSLGVVAGVAWAALGVAKLRLERSQAEPTDDDPEHALVARRNRLLEGPLAREATSRVWLGWGATVILPLLVACGVLVSGAHPIWMAIAALALVGSLGGEWLERHLFFRAAVAPRMPGS
ncbi:MAG: DmsC/YnfH family molybdoenzyme membrane anchor subunit [Myxococcota bacterium]